MYAWAKAGPTTTDREALWPAPAVRRRWEQIIGLLAPQPGEQLLDLGCGAGQAARLLADMVGPGGRVAALDRPSPAMRRLGEAASQEGTGSLDVVAGSAEAVPFADASFDAALCVNVLEAVSDRARALHEIRRVLKPGGRALVAHDDYESQAYTSTDRELGRRATLAYACSTFESYATSDGQMGRRLWPLFVAAGFAEPRLQVLPLVETDYAEPHLGWRHAQFTAGLIGQVSDLTDAELDAWRADLAEQGRRGQYVYCLNLYVCLGRA
jgi:SAM-dependent methyltransferase